MGNQEAEKEGDPRSRALQLIDLGLLASAHALLVEYDIALDTPVLTERIEDCLKRGAARKKDGMYYRPRQNMQQRLYVGRLLHIR